MRFAVCALTALLTIAANPASAATLEERVASLESSRDFLRARVSKLEGTLTEEQMVGKYTYYHMRRLDGVDSNPEPLGPLPYVIGDTSRGTVTLNSDGTMEVSGTTKRSSVDGKPPLSEAIVGRGFWSWSGTVLTVASPHGDTTLMNHKFRHAAAGRLFLSIDTFPDTEGYERGSEEWVEILIRN